MEILIMLLLMGLVVFGGIAVLTALINSVLVAVGLSAVSCWTVVTMLAILSLIKWFIS